MVQKFQKLCVESRFKFWKANSDKNNRHGFFGTNIDLSNHIIYIIFMNVTANKYYNNFVLSLISIMLAVNLWVDLFDNLRQFYIISALFNIFKWMFVRFNHSLDFITVRVKIVLIECKAVWFQFVVFTDSKFSAETVRRYLFVFIKSLINFSNFFNGVDILVFFEVWGVKRFSWIEFFVVSDGVVNGNV